jgi:hypothetical protein
VQSWITTQITQWAADNHSEHHRDYQEVGERLNVYATYIDDGLAEYLRGYLFWLTTSRVPLDGEPLPEL